MARREKGGRHPDKTVFVVPVQRHRERTQQIYVLQEVSQICGVADRLPRVNCMLWLLINSQFKFLCAHLSICLFVLSIHARVSICLTVWHVFATFRHAVYNVELVEEN